MKKFIVALIVLLFPTSVLAETYYIDFTSGSDANDGTSMDSAWKYAPGMSLASGNAASVALQAGDIVYFKMGEVWRDQLTINASGSADGGDITFARKTDWGIGDNPRILCSEALTSADWTQIDETYDIWQASNDLKYMSYGMLNGDASTGDLRVSHYSRATTEGTGSCPDYSGWENEWYCGTEDGTYVYYRDTSGNPGDREIGVRPYGVYGLDRSYITIDGIDVHGPIGSSTGTGDEYLTKFRGPINFKGGSHITVRNCNTRHSRSVGIGFHHRGISHTVVEDCTLYDHWGGLWWQSTSGGHHRASRNYISGISIVEREYSDSGDRDMLGTYLVEGDIIIEDNYFGPPNGHDDYQYNGGGITLSDQTGGVIIRRNYIQGAARCGVLIGGNGGGTEIYNNIIDGWGTKRATGDENFWSNGILVGAGATASENHEMLVYNNLLVNGPEHTSNFDGRYVKNAAIFVSGNSYTDLKVVNNLITKNSTHYALVWNGGSATGTRDVSYNYFDQRSGLGIGESVGWGGETSWNADQITDADTLDNGDWEDSKTYASSNYSYAEHALEPSLTTTIGGTKTLSASTPETLTAGGALLTGDVAIAVDSNRVWTPFEERTMTTVERDSSSAIGPFEYQTPVETDGDVDSDVDSDGDGDVDGDADGDADGDGDGDADGDGDGDADDHPGEQEGCSCQTAPNGASPIGYLVLLAALSLVWRRHSRSQNKRT